MPYGIRVWRYRYSDGNRWVNISSKGVRSVLGPSEVATGMATIRDGHWLFEQTHDRPVPASLTTNDILSIVSNSEVPATANVWCWKGGKCRRVYHRTTEGSNPDEAPLQVQAAVGECEDLDLILDCGTEKPPVVIHRSVLTAVETDQAEGEIRLDVPQGGTTSAEVYVATVRFISDRGPIIEAQIRAAAEALNRKDPGAFEAAAEALFESFTGAAPAPTQGTNVVHQMNAAVDDITKIGIAIDDHSKATYDASGAQGDFGSGVATVDQTWQAAASVFASVADCIRLYQMGKQYSSAEQGQHIDLDKMVMGRGATLAANVSKSYTSIGGAVNSISSAASGASALSSGVFASLPAVGAVTGLATMVRSSWQSEKSRKRASRLKDIMTHQGQQMTDLPQKLLEFGMGKAIRKHRFKAAEAVVGAGSMSAGTCLAVGAALATANAWNLVGWGIGAACVVAGGVLLSYKIHRSRKSKKRARDRGFTTQEFPGLLVQTYLQCYRQDVDSVDTLALDGVLDSYGVDTDWLHMGAALEEHSAESRVRAAVFRISRHLG